MQMILSLCVPCCDDYQMPHANLSPSLPGPDVVITAGAALAACFGSVLSVWVKLKVTEESVEMLMSQIEISIRGTDELKD